MIWLSCMESSEHAAVTAERLRRQKTCTYPDEDRSLAGTFVDIIRQQNLQRACLMDWGAQQYWKETDHMADCCKCKKLSYITVAIDGKADAVSISLCQSASTHSCLSSLMFSQPDSTCGSSLCAATEQS